MKKYVLDIKKDSVPTYRGGDFTFVFDNLSQLKNFIVKKFGTKGGHVYVCITEIEVTFDGVNEVETSDISMTFDTSYHIGESYVLTFLNSGVKEYEFTDLTKADLKNKIRYLSNIVGANVGVDSPIQGHVRTFYINTSSELISGTSPFDIGEIL